MEAHPNFLIELRNLIIIFPVYFAPTIIAFLRRHPNKLAIFFYNLLFGLLVFPWLVALYYGGTGKKPGIGAWLYFPLFIAMLMAIAWPAMNRNQKRHQEYLKKHPEAVYKGRWKRG